MELFTRNPLIADQWGTPSSGDHLAWNMAVQSGEIVQSVLAPAGVHASSIHHLWLLMLGTTAAVFSIVMAVGAIAVWRGTRRSANAPVTSERALTRSVAVGIAATVLILFALLVASVWTGNYVESLHASNGVSIAITGHQWWWEIEYEDAVPARRVVIANELHIPVNRAVALKVSSKDVIHSFWVPNLQGKRDLIPGYTTAIWMQADRPGVFRGQCAEFCGLQHAHMALDVIAEPDADFERWLDGMRQPAHPPATDIERRGHDVFMNTRCAGCHTIAGTRAQGLVGPDLTHIGSRSTLAAGTLPNTADHLAAWVRNPQASKPGNQMPPTPLSDDDTNALMTYLQALR